MACLANKFFISIADILVLSPSDDSLPNHSIFNYYQIIIHYNKIWIKVHLNLFFFVI